MELDPILNLTHERFLDLKNNAKIATTCFDIQKTKFKPRLAELGKNYKCQN